jgi:hypothetical protein
MIHVLLKNVSEPEERALFVAMIHAFSLVSERGTPAPFRSATFTTTSGLLGNGDKSVRLPKDDQAHRVPAGHAIATRRTRSFARSNTIRHSECLGVIG